MEIFLYVKNFKMEKIQKSFEQEENERRLKLLDDDVRVARRQLSVLIKQCEDASSNLVNLEAHLNKLKKSNIHLDKDENDYEPKENNGYFSIIRNFEQQNLDIEEQKKKYKKLLRDLSSQRNILRNKIKELSERLESDTERAENEEAIMDEYKNLIQELEAQFTDNEAEINFKQTKNMQYLNEVKELNQRLLQREASLSENQQIHKSIEDKLSDIQMKIIQKKEELKQIERSIEPALEEKKKKLESLKDPNNWKPERDHLMSKLQSLNSRIQTETKHFNSYEKKLKEMNNKFIELLGNDDPGDGTGLYSCQILNTELQNMNMNRNSVTDEDLETECYYNDQLQEELKVLNKTMSDLNKYHRDQLKSLQNELSESQQDGYIKILLDERAELQTEMNGEKPHFVFEK